VLLVVRCDAAIGVCGLFGLVWVCVHVDLWRAAHRMLNVRGTRALLLAILVGVAVLTPRSLGENATRACAGRFSCVGARPPAPITIAAGHCSARSPFASGATAASVASPALKARSRGTQRGSRAPALGT
jgi:hypothetical protein